MPAAAVVPRAYQTPQAVVVRPTPRRSGMNRLDTALARARSLNRTLWRDRLLRRRKPRLSLRLPCSSLLRFGAPGILLYASNRSESVPRHADAALLPYLT